jgi:ABC-type transporter Mla subunit MlaD
VLNFLFGTATIAELQNLHQVVEEFKLQLSVITNSLEQQLRYTKELDENVRQSTQDITLLARVLKLQVNDLEKLNSTVKKLDTIWTTRLELLANVSHTEN